MRLFLFLIAALLIISIPVMPWVDFSLGYKTHKTEIFLRQQKKDFQLKADWIAIRRKHIQGF